jgi:hypothetical protein
LPGGHPIAYVVTAPRDESDPAPLLPGRWGWLQDALKFKWLDGEKESMSATVTSQRTGKELYLLLLSGVMLLAFGEMVLVRKWNKST